MGFLAQNLYNPMEIRKRAFGVWRNLINGCESKMKWEKGREGRGEVVLFMYVYDPLLVCIVYEVNVSTFFSLYYLAFIKFLVFLMILFSHLPPFLFFFPTNKYCCSLLLTKDFYEFWLFFFFFFLGRCKINNNNK